MWKEPWRLVKNEITLVWKPYIVTLLATMIMGFFSAAMLEDMASFLAGKSAVYNSVSLDVLFIILTPCLTIIFFSSPYLSFRTIKEDPFGKRMALYRVLPISTKVLVRSRMLIMLATFVTLSIVFYSTIAISLSDSFYDVIPIPLFLTFVLFWIGFSLAVGSIHVFIEYGTNGKVLYIFSFLYGLSILTFIISYNLFVNSGLVMLVMKMLQQSSLLPLIIIFLLSILSYHTWGFLLTKRLNKRDYL